MPNSNFNSFLANYWSSIACKKIRFCIPKTVFNFFILKTLLADGYIWSFAQKKNKYEVISIDLATNIKINKIILYTSQKRSVYVNFKQLLVLTKSGGYYVLSTPLGIMNDSDARYNKVGGLLLFAIF
jgi:ribosomal protein S8